METDPNSGSWATSYRVTGPGGLQRSPLHRSCHLVGRLVCGPRWRFPASLVSWLAEACVSCPKLGVLTGSRSCEDPGLRSVGGGPAPHLLPPAPPAAPSGRPSLTPRTPASVFLEAGSKVLLISSLL